MEENKNLFKGYNYAGYYDENDNFCISITKEVAEEILSKITDARVEIEN